jgi:hypothetical protein
MITFFLYCCQLVEILIFSKIFLTLNSVGKAKGVFFISNLDNSKDMIFIFKRLLKNAFE